MKESVKILMRVEKILMRDMVKGDLRQGLKCPAASAHLDVRTLKNNILNGKL